MALTRLTLPESLYTTSCKFMQTASIVLAMTVQFQKRKRKRKKMLKEFG